MVFWNAHLRKGERRKELDRIVFTTKKTTHLRFSMRHPFQLGHKFMCATVMPFFILTQWKRCSANDSSTIPDLVSFSSLEADLLCRAKWLQHLSNRTTNVLLSKWLSYIKFKASSDIFLNRKKRMHTKNGFPFFARSRHKLFVFFFSNDRKAASVKPA